MSRIIKFKQVSKKSFNGSNSRQFLLDDEICHMHELGIEKRLEKIKQLSKD